MLRAVAKHSPQLAQSVVDCGALDALVICLEEFDPGVKESAAWALGYIARHNSGRFRLLCPLTDGNDSHKNGIYLFVDTIQFNLNSLQMK